MNKRLSGFMMITSLALLATRSPGRRGVEDTSRVHGVSVRGENRLHSRPGTSTGQYLPAGLTQVGPRPGWWNARSTPRGPRHDRRLRSGARLVAAGTAAGTGFGGRWPRGIWSIRHAMNSLGYLLDNPSSPPDARIRGIQSANTLCAGLPASLPQYPDLAFEISRLQFMVKHRVELRAPDRYGEPLVSLVKCLERFDTLGVAEPIGMMGPTTDEASEVEK